MAQKCKKHKIILTYKAGKAGVLFCKVCDREFRNTQTVKIILPKVETKPKKKWWEFWK